MIVERTMSEGFLSNSYMVADEPGGHAVLIDSGGPAEPILAKIDQLGVKVTHLLCTHRHVDHVSNNAVYVKRYKCPIASHPEERQAIGGVDIELGHGDALTSGKMKIGVLHTPGHTSGMLNFAINDEHVFTGDTLFKGSVGGTRAPGHTNFEDLHHSIMEILMKLPRSMKMHPGHTDPSTVGDEWENNPFIRMWRGVDREGTDRCTAFGRPATLLLSARDYDGGRKCWVRFDDGTLDIAPGSQVSPA